MQLLLRIVYSTKCLLSKSIWKTPRRCFVQLTDEVVSYKIMDEISSSILLVKTNWNKDDSARHLRVCKGLIFMTFQKMLAQFFHRICNNPFCIFFGE